MTDDSDPTEEIREADVQAITQRIQKVTQARVLADVGKFDQALILLRAVRDKYDEERQRERVDWMIQEVERRKSEADAPE